METLLFPFSDFWWAYLAFAAFVAVLLALDLGVFHRKAHAISFKEATGWSLFWVALALAINFAFYRYALQAFGDSATATRLGFEFLTGFVIEKALAVDNIFVFVLVFAAFRIPPMYQHRVLFFGVLGAIVFRAAFIAMGSHLMAYQWVVVAFGALLIVTGIKMLFHRQTEQPDYHKSWIARQISRVLPISTELHGQKFLVRLNGILHATPLLLALAILEISDIIFAVDSVPAIFAVTREPLIVFVSNILAILGMRSLYFMLAGVVDRFAYLKFGLAAVLVFVGLKMVWLNDAYGGHFPVALSLGIIGILIFGSVALSLLVTRRAPTAGIKRNPRIRRKTPMSLKLAKRVLLMVAVNVLIVVTLSIVLQVIGINSGLGGRQIDFRALAAFCLVWGFGAALLSLALSRVMARWMMGVRVIDPRTSDPADLELVEMVHALARKAGITRMPEVGLYDSPELNAFATGPTRNRALVAVSSGLLASMDRDQIEGVLAHEVAHVANGDMVTMTLLQGVINAFVMFLARVVAFIAGQFVSEERRPLIQMGIVLVLEIGLGILGMLVVAAFSRRREFKADAGGAYLVGPGKVIAALKGLRRAQQVGDDELVDDGRSPALASLKISARAGGIFQLLSTHPELDERIDRLEEIRLAGGARLARARPALWAS